MDIVTFALGKKYTNKSIASAMIGAKSITQENDKIKIVTFDDTVFYLDVDGLFTDAEREKLASFSDDLSRLDISDTGEILIDGSLVKADSVTTADIVSNVTCGAIKPNSRVKSGSSLQSCMEQLLVEALAPSVSISAVISDGQTATTVREKGVPVNATSINATVTKKTSDIKSVVWSGGIVHTESSPSTSTKTYTQSKTGIEETTTFTVTATDIDGRVGKNSLTLTFVDAMRKLIIDGNKTIDVVTEDDILACDKLLKTKATFTESYTVDGLKIGLAYPSSYGNLTQIVDVANNSNIISGFKTTTMNITTESGVVEYNIYLGGSNSVVDNCQIKYVW